MKKVKIIFIFVTSLTCLSFDIQNEGITDHRDQNITIQTLLNELTSFDEVASYPSTAYILKQISSYDRRSVSPNKPGWFANDDGFGFIRLDTISGRIEKVLFDEKGPGAITRIWLTTSTKNGVLRFYFDDENLPRFEIPSYDMSITPFYVGNALSMIHTNYSTDINGTGGNTFMFPLPYNISCKITFEEPDYTKKIPRYYQINYRTYSKGVDVKTFTINEANSIKEYLEKINNTLLNPPTFTSGIKKEKYENALGTGKSIKMELPDGENAVRTLIIDAKSRKGDYAKMMRDLIVKMRFDGEETVWVPLSDFSGAGFGAAKINSWFMSADGRGKVISRWVMPYKKNAEIEIKSLFNFPVDIKIETYSTHYTFNTNTLYFHTSWKQERDVLLTKWDANYGQSEWTFVDILGRGVYRGDLLTLYNYAPDWYGEGDEKIYVDDDIFPSFFGTGTEDYYNCSWAPVVPFYTPFGGAPRADNPSSQGFNSYVRTRNLDAIPFSKKLRFDIELLSWNNGQADYATTVYWYGDFNAKVKSVPSEEEILQKIPNCYSE